VAFYDLLLKILRGLLRFFLSSWNMRKIFASGGSSVRKSSYDLITALAFNGGGSELWHSRKQVLAEVP
jgi:hypothetical protein